MDILDKLSKYSRFGEKILEDGTYLIGKATHIAPQAWLHSIFPGLDIKHIQNLEQELKVSIPSSYIAFLLQNNGLKLFNTTLCLDGIRSNNRRDLNSLWQPFDIRTKNLFERPTNSKKHFFFIGGYDWDGSMVYIDSLSESVHLCSNDDATSLLSWSNFENMLSSEIDRLIALFDDKGLELDITASTLPRLI
ncbi:SMI1/KNR4 family protein [Pedobacter aquatilis]|uniref:SMI1/KNR4 family protein n=1 Tax=Pedobacter aquatilis TaxID=351343 RepID=UPI00292FFE57|nr:SMI1/KNR4 family protein [Pedobacter aquatilis]